MSTRCQNCGNVTYAGCGDHLDDVFTGVPVAERCACDSGAPLAAPMPTH